MGSASRRTPEQDLVEKEKARQEKLLQTERTRIENEEGIAAATAIRDAAIARQRLRGRGQGRAGTLLTGPGGLKGGVAVRGSAGSMSSEANMGVSGLIGGGAKTLLGS